MPRTWVPRGVATSLLCLAACCLTALSPRSAAAKTFSFPHVLETSGRITNTQNTFDTQFFMTYSGGVAGSPDGEGATVDLYVFDQVTGQPMRSATGADVCNPCMYSLGNGAAGSPPRKRTVVLDSEITAKGGFRDPTMAGFAIAVINGDVGNVNLTAAVVNAKTSAQDLGAIMVLPPQELCPGGVPTGTQDAAAGSPCLGPTINTHVFPHILERPGTIGTTPYTFDTQLFMIYCGGLAGIPGSGGAIAHLYLFDEATGGPLQSGTADVCNPCTVELGDGAQGTATPRKRVLRIDDLIMAAGGFGGAAEKLGFGVVVVTGADPDNVRGMAFVTNAKSSALDLAVFVFEPQPLEAVALAAVPADAPGSIEMLRAAPNPALDGMNLSFRLARAADVELEIFDSQGRRVASLFKGRREAGTHSVRWDRRDGTGRTLGAGMYFGRLRAGDGSGMTRLVLVP
jgi:flagellar hook capping protein FlgD